MYVIGIWRIQWFIYDEGLAGKFYFEFIWVASSFFRSQHFFYFLNLYLKHLYQLNMETNISSSQYLLFYSTLSTINNIITTDFKTIIPRWKTFHLLLSNRIFTIYSYLFLHTILKRYTLMEPSRRQTSTCPHTRPSTII